MMGQTTGLEKKALCTAPVEEFTIAKFGADDDTLSSAAAATDELIGIFQHATEAAAKSVRVMLTGISRLKLGGTVTRGDLITSDANAKGIKATQHQHTQKVTTGSTGVADSTTGALVEDSLGAETALRAMGTAVDTTYDIGKADEADAVRIIGKALASGVDGDIIPVLLAPGIA